MGSNILLEQQPKFYQNVVKPLQESKKVQHAYLIETKNVLNKEELVLAFVEELFKLKLNEDILPKEKLHTLLENGSFPDLKILKTSASMIKKEELFNVKEALLETSVYDGYQIYIIYDADKLNTSSANTILKFLEEPEEGIIAVLTTDNRYQMLDTILSRCQILTFEQYKTQNEELSIDTKNFLELLSRRKQQDLMLNYQQIQEQIFIDRQKSITILNELNQFLSNLLKDNYQISSGQNQEEINAYQDYFSQEELIQILEIIEKKYQELQFNVHFKSWLDTFLLQLMEV